MPRSRSTDLLRLEHYEPAAALAKEAGLNADEARYGLEGDAWIREVRADEQEARRLGIGGVPFFAFDRRFAVSGAQPSEVLLKALEKAWAERE
ncbi:MAG: DsbA family protein [Flavobacteriales bacterium]